MAPSAIDGFLRTLNEEKRNTFLQLSEEVFWDEFDFRFGSHVEDNPDEPLVDELIALFNKKNQWKTFSEQLEVVFKIGRFLNGEKVTSTGRWVLMHLDKDAETVITCASRNKEPEILNLLATCRPDLFETLGSAFPMKDDNDRLCLIGALLKVDANKYEKEAVALIETIGPKYYGLPAAKLLHQYFPKKYHEITKSLLLANVLSEEAWGLAWDELGEAAGEVWDAYAEPNHAIRLKFYATLHEKAGAFAEPWLIKGLLHEWDGSVYGYVTHAKYVMRLLELLTPFDLTPYRDQIKAAFATTKDKKTQELIAKALGEEVKTKLQKRRDIFDGGKKGYKFDVYMSEMVDCIFEELVAKRHEVSQPVKHIHLGGWQSSIQLNFLVINGKEWPEMIEVDSKIPMTCDDEDDDKIIRKFHRTHKVDPEDFHWGDCFGLPLCALIHEQLLGLQQLVERLKAAGLEVSDDCRITCGDDDNDWEDFEETVLEEFEALPDEYKDDLATMFYESKEKQAWIKGGQSRSE
jgi:hypothetical protein